MAADLQRAEVLQAHEGGGGEELDLAELDGELVELEQLPELVRVHDRFVEVDVGTSDGESVGVLDLGETKSFTGGETYELGWAGVGMWC